MTVPRILIVEDESIVALDLKEHLIESGYDPVDMVDDGVSACERALELRPDLVLMDIHLPGEMDGVEAADRIRGELDIPVVFLTAYADDQTLKRAREAEPYGYLVKPFDAKQLQTTIGLALRNFQRQEELFETRDILNGLLHTATEGFFIMDERGRFLEANDAYCEMVGYDRKELLGLSVKDVDADESSEEILSSIGRMREELRMSLQKRHRAKSGEILDVSLKASLFETKAGYRVCVFCRDITETLRREKLMRLQTNALAAAANAVVITRRDGRIEWVNRAFSRFTGYTPEEAIGQDPGELLNSGRHTKRFYRNMWRTILRGDVWRGELVNKRKDGEEYQEEMTITPLFDEAGEITHFIAIKQDITEQKELEQKFHRAQRLESIGTLASGVAHDLNNVLSPIIMSSDLMKVQTEDAHFKDMLDMIKESAQRGAGIIRQLLSFARGSEGPYTEVQLRPLLRELTKVFRETFPKNITLEDQVDSDLKPVWGDSTQLHQVFTNLMINARDAMPRGGDLQLLADNHTVTREESERNPELEPGEYVRVRVVDHGTGMSEGVLEKIFDPFFTTKKSGEGTGLGLATSLGILKSHHGALLVESHEGDGSTFSVLIPVHVEEEPHFDVPPDAQPPQGDGERLLVVDDEESIRFMLRGSLSALGYQVDLASNGREALERVQEAEPPYDLVMLDMMMPELDGVGFLRELEKTDRRPEVLVMSGMVGDERLEEMGLDREKAFLAKPFTIHRMAHKVRRMLDS